MKRNRTDHQEGAANADATTRLREIRRAKVYAAYLEAANDPVFMAEMRAFDPYTPPDDECAVDPLT